MIRLAGSVCVFAAVGMAWRSRLLERRRRRRLLAELAAAFEWMETEIRLAQTPLPRLLEQLERTCGADASALFQRVSASLHADHPPRKAWAHALADLPLPEGDKRALFVWAESMQGDEESACKGLKLVSENLRDSLKKAEQQRANEDQRAAALYFSAAALMVILLI